MMANLTFREIKNQFCLLSICLLFYNLSFIKGEYGKLQTEVLDSEGKFIFSWRVDEKSEKIEFELTVQTKGWIGFGLSPNGGMKDSDMVIGGVRNDGSLYFSDRFGIGNTMPVLDSINDWHIINGFENATHTFLRFWRLLNTCDYADFPITKATSRVIYAFSSSESDRIDYHHEKRGSKSLNLLDDPYPTKQDLSELKSWSIAMNMEMPERQTTYQCSIHRGPKVDKKNHVVGFSTILGNKDAIQHTHHFVVYKCSIPYELKDSMNNSVFESHVGGPGNQCYLPDSEQNLPIKFCQVYLYVSGAGTRKFLFPDNAGYPIGEDPEVGEYYMLEIHYDNPQKLKGVKYNAGIEIFYTDKLRKHDAGMLTTGLVVGIGQTLPPNVQNYIQAGHCGPDCTRNFPQNGVKLFNVLLHSHLAGRKIKLRHFRNESEVSELPWILNDYNYDFSYQQNRGLSSEISIMPGDHLILECEYDTTWRNGQVTIGGQSTQNEMCQTFMWYYPKSSLEFCTSSYPIPDLFEDFGIQNTTEGDEQNREIIVTSPEEMKGKVYSEAIEKNVKWTPELDDKLERKHRFSEHNFYCSTQDAGLVNVGKVKYPKIKEAYQPKDVCDEFIDKYYEDRENYNKYDREGVYLSAEENGREEEKAEHLENHLELEQNPNDKRDEPNKNIRNRNNGEIKHERIQRNSYLNSNAATFPMQNKLIFTLITISFLYNLLCF